MRHSTPLGIVFLLTVAVFPARAGTDGFPGFPPGFPALPPEFPPAGPPPPAPTGLVTPVGPFTGGFVETWESRENHLTPTFHLEPNPTTIAGGAASLSSLAPLGIYEPGSAEFFIGFPVAAQVADGRKGLAVSGATATAVLSFAAPVTDFGAYWGSGWPSNGVTVRFFNAAGAEADRPATFAYARNGSFPGGDGVLEWHGWHSAVPLTFVSFTGDYVAIDGVRAVAAAPEPGVALGAVAGACVLLLRRCRVRGIGG